MEKFLKLREVEAITAQKKSSIYAKIKAGKFPRPVRLSTYKDAGAVAWCESEIAQWQQARISARDENKIAA